MKAARLTRADFCVSCGDELTRRAVNAILCFPCVETERKVANAAMRAVKKAIKSGHLPEITAATPCTDCGAPARVYDHRDYRSPLAVDPVCVGCNVRRGVAAPFNAYLPSVSGSMSCNVREPL